MKLMWIRELEKWEKVKIDGKLYIFQYMDWMYALLKDEAWYVFNVSWYVRKEWDYYVFDKK